MPRITTNKRFFKKDKKTHEYLIKNGYVYLPNYANGGDDDYIIIDTVNKEFTYGENGFMPFCDVDRLNKYHTDKNLKELMHGQYRY